MRARFIAGSEQEIASIVCTLQTSGCVVTQLSSHEIELDLPKTLAEESQSATGHSVLSETETSTKPESFDCNLSQPADDQPEVPEVNDHPEIVEREFVLAPFFRDIRASLSGRYLQLHRHLGQKWDANTRRVQGPWQVLSQTISRCWKRVREGLQSSKKTVLQPRVKLAPRNREAGQQRRLLVVSYRTADRVKAALAGAVGAAMLILAYLALIPDRPNPVTPLQAEQATPRFTTAPSVPHLIATVRAATKTAAASGATGKGTAAGRKAVDAEDARQDVIVRQFPRRPQPSLQQ